jgi:hypothetical protein
VSRGESERADLKTRKRVRRYGMFMHDVEIFDQLGLPEKLGRKLFRQLDKQLPGRRRFPQPVAMVEGRRFFPAVKRYFMDEFGGLPTEATTIAPGSWQEDFDETDQARGPRDARPRLATSQ